MKPPEVLHPSLAAPLALALLALCALAPGHPAVAQDEPGALASSPQSVRSSPFDPPTEDTFLTDSGPGLDTGCTFNTDPEHPLIIDILVDQAVGEVDGDGFLVDAASLVSAGVIPATVEVIMPAFDVDINGPPPPENDEALLNGESLGLLTGDNQIWKLNAFNVPVGKIKFPAPPAAGSTPTPRANRVQINIDLLATGRWCTAIDWVALVIPIKLPTAFKLEPTAGNKIRENASSATIDTIYEQSFDADCNLMTDIGPYDEYPFSGPAKVFFGLLSGSARLHATLETCPRNDQLSPEVVVEWEIAGTSLDGVDTWDGYEGDIELSMPSQVGAYDVALAFKVDGKDYPIINRKLFVTRKKPLSQVDPPRRGWYEKAASWASGQADEGPILTALLGGLYSFGGTNWRYGYNFGAVGKCSWTDLVADPITCDYADCFVFSDVLENMAATLGVGGLAAVTPRGSANRGFLTNATPSLDPAFPGNARPIGGSSYDRYRFSSHSLRRKSQYYDATFNGIYASSTAFITANVTGGVGFDADGFYEETAENWNIYDLGGNSYDSWGNYAYKPATPIAPPLSPEAVANEAMSVTSDIEFTGNVAFALVDDDLDGIAEALGADVEVQVNATGQYTILGTLEKGGQLVANRPSWESMLTVRETVDEIPGTYTVSLQFSGEQIYRSAEDGPYDLVLYAIASDGFDSATPSSPAYDHTSFGEVDSRFTGVSESAVDSDGDGEFDYIEVLLDLELRLDGELRLQGALDKGGQTVADAGVAVNLGAGLWQVPLQFDGGSIRRSGLDGPYDGNVNLIDAEGHTIDSIGFTTNPYSAGSFSALLEPSGSFSANGVDTNSNGLFDLLRVDFGAEIGRAGTYLLTGVLRGPTPPAAVFTDTQIAAAAGSTTIRLDFPGPKINAQGLDGPYTVEVLVREVPTLADLDAVLLPQMTGAFLHTEFDPFGATNLPIILTGESDDYGVDTDGNGLFDELVVEVEVALANSDFYEWGARLVDSNNTELGFFTRRASLPAGLATIDFVFDGERIGNNGVDGPYFVKGLLIFGTGGANLVSVEVAETQAYRVTQFEGADVEPPQIVLAAGPAVLWPPNHKYNELAVTDFVLDVTDDRDPNVSVADVVITQATSDEPDDAPDGGDGATQQDLVIAQDCRSVTARAERAGGGNGRVYTVHLEVADASGNVGTASYAVIVPHDASAATALDDGPQYTVEGCMP